MLGLVINLPLLVQGGTLDQGRLVIDRTLENVMSSHIMAIQEVGEKEYLVGGWAEGLVVIQLREGNAFDKLRNIGDL